MEEETTDTERVVPGLDMTERELRLRLVEQAMRQPPPDFDVKWLAGQAFNFVMGQSGRSRSDG
ncbi:hypothetical protein [Roseovarius ramblicola]|uniref:Uncharacterized protein n=1 Tax=Roseovarius ramblicola TaxID=2022336 RepID=A0ABV5HYR9_9RHOB